MTKTTKASTFLNSDDEEKFWQAATAFNPALKLVDGSRWASEVPPVQPSPKSCSSAHLYIWDASLVERLPSRERAGRFDGPQSGIVIQWSRTRVQEHLLLSGRLAISTEESNEPVDEFIAGVFTELRRFTSNDLSWVGGGPARGYRIGPSARVAVMSGEMSLRDRSVERYLKLPG